MKEVGVHSAYTKNPHTDRMDDDTYTDTILYNLNARVSPHT
jgi:hypothetical protein